MSVSGRVKMEETHANSGWRMQTGSLVVQPGVERVSRFQRELGTNDPRLSSGLEHGNRGQPGGVRHAPRSRTGPHLQRTHDRLRRHAGPRRFRADSHRVHRRGPRCAARGRCVLVAAWRNGRRRRGRPGRAAADGHPRHRGRGDPGGRVAGPARRVDRAHVGAERRDCRLPHLPARRFCQDRRARGAAAAQDSGRGSAPRDRVCADPGARTWG